MRDYWNGASVKVIGTLSLQGLSMTEEWMRQKAFYADLEDTPWMRKM